MENFIAFNPTKLHFGAGVINDLGKTVLLYGKTVLLVYGRGSVMNNGTYRQVKAQLTAAACTIVEYAGIKPNPVIADVNAAAALGREHHVDVIVALGGGSVIDSAKIISITIPVQHDGWEFMVGKKRPASALPLIAVLTLAATGSEMNCFAVVQNPDARMKPGYGHALIYPKHSFLDPAFTLSVPANQTAFGIVDLVAHSLEAYFDARDATLSDRFVYAVVNEALTYGPWLMKDLHNVVLRGKIMYAATCALNGLLFHGRMGGDWGVHNFGHVFSLLYDIPHGATLSMVYPAWLKWQLENIPDRIAELGKNLWGFNDAERTIAELTDFFHTLGSPVSLAEWTDTATNRQDVITVAGINKVSGASHKMTPDDYGRLYDLMQ